MGHHLIFIANDGTTVSLTFQLNEKLDGLYYGLWMVEKNKIMLCTEAWQFYQAQRGNAGKLKSMMGRLLKVSQQFLEHF